MKEILVHFQDEQQSIRLAILPGSEFHFVPSWGDKCILFTWVSKTTIANLIQLRMLKLGLIWPFIFWIDCITDME